MITRKSSRLASTLGMPSGPGELGEGGREPLFLIWKVEMRPPALAPARLAAWFHPQPLCSEVTHRRVRGEAGL